MDKLIITAALVGAEVTRQDTPHLPVTPEEIGEAAEEAREAGAAIAHIHVRDARESPVRIGSCTDRPSKRFENGVISSYKYPQEEPSV